MSIGQRIKDIRTEQRMSRAVLAKAAGMAYSTVADIENGHMTGSTRLPEIARALGVSAYWLKTGAGKSRPESAFASLPKSMHEPQEDYGDGVDHRALFDHGAELNVCIKTLAHAMSDLPEAKRAPAADLLAAISRSPNETVLQDSLCRLLTKAGER